MIQNIPIAIVNTFLLPMISMKVYYARQKKNVKIDGEFILQYGVYTTVIPIIAKIFIKVLEYIIPGKVIMIDGSYYGMIAGVIALIIPYFVEWFKKNSSIKIEISRIEE